MTDEEKRIKGNKYRAEWRAANPDKVANYEMKRSTKDKAKRALLPKSPPKPKQSREAYLETRRRYREKNKDRIAAKKRADYLANPDATKEKVKAWKQANPDKVAEHYDKHRAARSDAKREWVEANRDKVREVAKQQAVLRKRVRAAQIIAKHFVKETRAVYRACPKGMTVDHIVPLRGKLVTGLHVPWNLQYLTKAENIVKGNRFPSDA